MDGASDDLWEKASAAMEECELFYGSRNRKAICDRVERGSLMKRTLDAGSIFLAMLFFLSSPLMAGTLINSATDIGINSTTSGGDTYVLNPGDYTINTAFDMSGDTYKKVNVGSGVTLTADNSGNDSGLFALDTLLQNGGDVKATGGTNTSSYFRYGIAANNYSLSAGNIIAQGGNGGNATYDVGIYIGQSLVQSGGLIQATAGNSYAAHGIHAENTFRLTDGTLNAIGGAGTDAFGLYAATFTQDGGNITATSVKQTTNNNLAYGLQTANFIQNNGTITANGGTPDRSAGMNAATSFVQYGGTLSATAGDGLYSYGLVTPNLTQHTGKIEATGGVGASSYGISSAKVIQNAGEIIAAGGTGTEAYGIYGSETSTINGTLRMSRQGSAASFYVRNRLDVATAITLESSSILSPTIDFNNLAESGLLQVRSGDIEIESGARLLPELVNVSGFTPGTSITFIETLNGSINGTFANETGALGLTFGYKVSKVGGSSYLMEFLRLATPAQVLSRIAGRNTISLVSGLTQGLPAASGSSAVILDGLYSPLENFADINDMAAYALTLELGLTPHAFAGISPFILRQSDAVNLGFMRSLKGLGAAALQTASLSSGYALANPAGNAWSCSDTNSWHVWANPLYQQSSHIQTKSNEFHSAKERFGGITVGAARDFGKLTLGGQVHYLRGKYETALSDTDSDDFGILLGGRLHSLAPGGGFFNPWIEFSAGYAYGDYNQSRIDIMGGNNKSDPYTHLFSAGMALGNDFSFGCDKIVFSPQIGIDYAHIRNSGYSESNPGGLGLKVNRHIFNSLRPKVGVEIETRLSNKLAVRGRAFYRYETMDRNAVFNYGFIDAPTVSATIQGNKRDGSSGNIGAGLHYRATDKLSLSMDYDLMLEDRYISHQVNLGLGLSF